MANTNSIDLEASTGQGAETTSNFTDYGTAAVTVEAWIKAENPGTNAQIVAVNDGSRQTFELVKRGGYKFSVQAGSGGAESDEIPASTIEDGNWHHLAGVYDGNTVRLYHNGVEYGSGNALSANIITSNPAHLGVGYRPALNDLYFDGLIDEARVWSDARSGAEISNNFDTELTGGEAGLTFYWKANGDTTEETGNYTITLFNSPTYSTDVPFTDISYQISGTVTLNGNPVQGATIRCIRQSDNTALAVATTDASGNYTFTDLAQNELYHLGVEYEQAPDKYNALSLWDVAPVRV